MGPDVVAFLPVAALLTIAPGADTALVTKFALSRGRGAAFAATLGIGTGCAVHATFSALGLSVILARSATAYHTVRLAGAGYLIYLGARTLWETREARSARRAFAVGQQEQAPTAPSRSSALDAFGVGLLTNVLNPKVALFYLTSFRSSSTPRSPYCRSRYFSRRRTSRWASRGSRCTPSSSRSSSESSRSPR